MLSTLYFLVLSVVCLLPVGGSYDQLDSFTDSLLREVMSGIQGPEDTLNTNFDDYGLPSNNDFSQQQPKDYARSYESRRDAILGREPSLRDQEYLQHSSLFGHHYVQGGAGEGHQRLKPDGSMKNVEVVKTEKTTGPLPAYCNPPNPCPLGYSANDGCLEDFANTASFSREYQAAQDCMCDSEHMFDCPGATRENEIDALARSLENEGLAEAALDRLMQNMDIDGEHKVVAKKFFSHKPANPYLEGEKLPVVAKKTPRAAM